MQKHVNLVDLVKSFPTNIFLQNLASIQQRTSPLKFAHLAKKSEKSSISNLKTRAGTRSTTDRTPPAVTGQERSRIFRDLQLAWMRCAIFLKSLSRISRYETSIAKNVENKSPRPHLFLHAAETQLKRNISTGKQLATMRPTESSSMSAPNEGWFIFQHAT